MLEARKKKFMGVCKLLAGFSTTEIWVRVWNTVKSLGFLKNHFIVPRRFLDREEFKRKPRTKMNLVPPNILTTLKKRHFIRQKIVTSQLPAHIVVLPRLKGQRETTCRDPAGWPHAAPETSRDGDLLPTGTASLASHCPPHWWRDSSAPTEQLIM